MAIAVDSVSSGTGTGSSITVSHTTSGTNRLMLVGISGRASSGPAVVSGVTYNGVALSLVGSKTAYSLVTTIYKLVAPDTGTHDVVVSFSTAPDKGGVVGVVTFTGVSQTTPLGTFASASGSSTAPSVNVSSATGELVLDTLVDEDATVTMTAGAGQTERWNAQFTYMGGAGSTKAGDTTVTMSWTLSGSANWAIGAVPIKPITENVITLTESLGLVDTHSKVWSAHLSFTEILGLLDTVSAFKVFYLTLTESLGLIDTHSRTWSAYRTYNELLGLADTYSRKWDAYRTYAETLGLVDTISKIHGRTISLTESLGLVDTYSRVWSAYRTYAESLGLTDAVSKQISLHALTEVLGLVDSFDKYYNLTELDKLITKLIQLTEIGW